MGPPPDPPDPPEYGPTRPPRGREDTGVGRLKASSADSIQATVDEVLRRLQNRDEQSDIRRVDESNLVDEFKSWKIAQIERDARAKALRDLFVKLGIVAGLVAALLTAAWRTYVAIFPTPEPLEVGAAKVEAVQTTVEQRTEVLESTAKATTQRLEDVEGELAAVRVELEQTRTQASDGFDYIGRKLDAISTKAAKVERPASLPIYEEPEEGIPIEPGVRYRSTDGR
jgi:hypothetical protein